MLPHVVREEDLSKVGNRAKPAGEQITGDPDAAFKEADVVSEGEYGIPVITHCCLEPHGQTIQWKGDKVEYWPSTQNVFGIGNEMARAIERARRPTFTSIWITWAADSAANSPRTCGDRGAPICRKRAGASR